MKRMRFLKSCIVLLTGALSFSCVDESYDLTNLSTKMELFGNSMALPIGSTTVHLDSIIGNMGVDSSVLSVSNGTYVFRYTGNMDMSGLTNSMSDFSLPTVENISTTTDIFDATNVPYVPFDLEATDYTYYPNIAIDIPTISTDLIDIDSIELDNTILRIALTSVGLGGPKLTESFSIKFTAVGTGADYYKDGEPTTSWTVRMGETVEIQVRKLRLAGGLNKLNLQEEVILSIKEKGDVKATSKIMTTVTSHLSLHNFDYTVVYGKVDYEGDPASIDDINFDGLGNILDENNVLSFHNPTIQLTTSGNIGVPVDFTLNMKTSNSTTLATRSIDNTTFRMVPATSPLETKVNTFVIDRDNGTSELFKINPDIIRISYSFKTDTTQNLPHFVAKNSHLTMNYVMEIPLQFDSDLVLNMGTTIESPIDLSIFEEQDEDQVIGLTLNVKNHIPLSMKLKLTALDEDSVALFSTESDTIYSAPVDILTGKSTGERVTNTDLSLTHNQINKLKDTKKFRVGFVITPNSSAPYVSVQPSDYITIKVGVQIEGGIIIDPKKSSDNQEPTN